MKVNINQASCIECGTCKAVCPTVFDLDDKSKAYVLGGVNLNEKKECVKNAANMCPAQAISIEE